MFIVGRDADRTRGDRRGHRRARPDRVGWFAGDVGDEARVAEIVAAVLGAAGPDRRARQQRGRPARGAAPGPDGRRLPADRGHEPAGHVPLQPRGPPLDARPGLGVIVNLSSVLGLVGDALLPVYSATKPGILGLTHSTAIAYAAHGIRCVAICPGDVDTELNQRYFASQPDPVAFRARIEREYPERRIARARRDRPRRPCSSRATTPRHQRHARPGGRRDPEPAVRPVRGLTREDRRPARHARDRPCRGALALEHGHRDRHHPDDHRAR